MTNYLEYKKQQVQYWSKVSSLILASLPLLYKMKQKHADLDNIDGIVWLLLLIIAVITYYTSYYTISSFFWPEPLSVFNHLLLIPCAIWVVAAVYDKGTLLLGMLKD